MCRHASLATGEIALLLAVISREHERTWERFKREILIQMIRERFL